ncbi:aminopeptidase P family protein [Synergistaceae bacterium OttesenSCG-928-I11]|nr:aminopeptidase P family protein [Synergistaceae bacterium OttesenSCG-928-I11]
MIRVVCDRKKIFDKTGLDVVGQTISGSLFRDCRVKSFLLITPGGHFFVIADNLDRGDFEYRAKNVTRYFFTKTYLTYSGANGTPREDEYPDYVEAFRAAAHRETLILPGDMAVDTYGDLSVAFDILDDFTDAPFKTYTLYTRNLKTVLAQIHENDDVIEKKAFELICSECAKTILKPYLFDRRDTRYESLNAHMAEQGVASLLFASPMNIQEIAALNFDELTEKEVYAFYNAYDEQVYVVSSTPLDFARDMTPLGTNLSLREAFSAMDRSGPIGIEEESLTIARFRELNLAPANVKPFTKMLRVWRENRSAEDLPYYIVIARTTAYAIDGAKAWAEEEYYADRRFTEHDVFAEYDRLKYAFIEKNNIPIRLATYDPCTYSSDRSEYPCVHTEFLIPASAGSVRIDIGEFAKDKYGYIQATSDIARTVCLNPVVRKTHDFLLKVLRNDIIPNIRSGMKYSEIWSQGTKPIFEAQDMLKEMDMIPEHVELSDLYMRNIGHGMAKQTRTANFITKQNENCLPKACVGNIELPFNFRHNMVAVEDMWFCTPEGTVNITID